jgi:predicted enzyme related to lactoylglutathione lyase
MINPFVPRVGGIMSADIAVPQHESEVQFYSDVLSTGKSPLWREDLMNNLGMPVIGLGAQSPEYPDLPLQWMPHIQVADIARSVALALGIGGSEVLHGKDDEGNSQWAVLLDPNGAAFGLISVISKDDIPPIDPAISNNGAASIGCITWLELTVKKASTTRDFYQSVVGWSVQNSAEQDTSEDYKMLGDDGNPTAGIRYAGGENQVPPVWILYLPVGDIAESLRRVQKGGGKIIKQTADADGGIASAVVQDPVGVSFGLVQG